MTIAATCSGGGPVIVIPSELAASWRGTSPPIGVDVPDGWTWGRGDIVCDYDRACDTDTLRDFAQTEYGGVGWLAVGNGAALILDAELMTAWLSDPNGGYILRNYPESELDEAVARQYIAEAEQAGWRELSLVWTLSGGAIFLFDSAFPGAATPDDIEAHDGVAVGEVRPGTYAVSVATTAKQVDVIRVRRVD
ncbi:MAG: hypothetical protein IPM54_24370 [Polyangiaceae bacterium]|nr:hypothetical protein [Polyangiaceae bacterium]